MKNFVEKFKKTIYKCKNICYNVLEIKGSSNAGAVASMSANREKYFGSTIKSIKGEKTMKRVKMTIDQIRNEQRDYFKVVFGEEVDSLGICALVEVENMGWCKDGVTRWYYFTNEAGQSAVYYKH